jgi:drug/metabolite transporter (DMT)-like permease
LAALTLLGTVVGIFLFFLLIQRHGSALASLVTYLMPAVALAYGAAFLGEGVTTAKLVGMALILGGVALGSGLARPRRRRQVALTTSS